MGAGGIVVQQYKQQGWALVSRRKNNGVGDRDALI